jgi:hypothetical protein
LSARGVPVTRIGRELVVGYNPAALEHALRADEEFIATM